MSRDALVVGINSYSYKPLKGLRSPALDAEAIAQMLNEYGDFRVRRLPEAQINGTLRVGQSHQIQVSLEELEEELIKLFMPESKQIPDTALLYFSGHGLRKVRGRLQEGFLATSNVNPDLGIYGLSLQWLCRLLQESPVRQQIVWLDCCYSGELFNFKETLKDADPGNLGEGRDRCFIAASRQYEPAYAEIGSEHSVLTEALLKGLDPKRYAGRWVTNHTLADFLNQELKAVPQNPIYHNCGSPIDLTRWWSEPKVQSLNPELAKICPYKGLEYFDCNDEDAKYFYGRTAVADQLLEKVRSGNFLAVLGASGSGKSSVVRAGLLYQLKLGRRLSGSGKWQIHIIRPGEHPFQRLVETFVEPGLSVVDRATQLAKIKQLIGAGAAEGLGYLLAAVEAERVVLVVDQFEEAFTLCHNSLERQRFFECLLGALELTGNKLCLVLVMRADFFGKCAEQDYAGLAAKIQQHLVTVTPMKQDELEQAIAEPARQVGLEVEEELVTQMIADVEGSPGSLPLLQYTLTQLWQQRTDDQLTLSAYTHLGGVKGTLQKRADEIYQSLLPQEQLITKRIFLELTHLGEGTEDTRRQVLKQDLVTERESEALVEQVIQKLADAKLVVTSELLAKGSSGRVAVVDVAHEALIRYWATLRSWLDENRDRLRRQRQIEQATQLWQESGQQTDFLLAGVRLAEAEEIYHKYKDDLPLDVQRFILACLKEKQQQQLQEKRRHRQAKITAGVMGVLALIASSFGGFAYWQKQQAQLSEIAALDSSAEGLVSSNQHLEALFASLKAGKQLEHTIGVPEQLKGETASVLQQSLSAIQESNRLEGHRGVIFNILFSPDNKTFASSADDGSVKIWQLDGQLLATLDGKAGRVEFVSFSPDGKMLATSGWDGSFRLWQVNGTLLKTIKAHKQGLTGLSFSPDGKTLVSTSIDKTIKLWGMNGNLLKTIPVSSDVISAVSFSPNGKMLASAAGFKDKDGTIQLWGVDGTLLHTLKGHRGAVNRLNFSPDGNILVSTSTDGTIKLWALNGTLLHTLKGHTNTISRISFSPDGKTLASASFDETVKLWRLDGTLLKTLKGDGLMSGVSFSPDGKTLVSGSDKGTIKLWRLDGQLLKTIKGHRGWVVSVKFSPDGKRLISADDSGIIKLWRLDSNSPFVKILKGNSDVTGSFSFLNLYQAKIPQGVLSLSSSLNGKMLASAGSDSSIKLWRTDGTLLKTIKVDGGVSSVRFSPDSKILASSGWDGTIKLWRLDGQLLKNGKVFNSLASGVIFSPDGKLFAASSVGIIKIWRLDGTLLKTIEPGYLDIEIPKIRFSPDSKLLASTSSDGNIRLWQLDGKLLRIFKTQDGTYPQGVDFSSDGQTFAAMYNDGTLKLWRLDGTLIKTFKGPSEWMQARLISIDDKLLISDGHEDGTLQVWRLDDGRLLRTLKGHSGKTIWTTTLSSDSKMLASGGEDNSVHLWQWNQNLDDLMAKGCDWLHDYIKTNPNVSKSDRHLCDTY